MTLEEENKLLRRQLFEMKFAKEMKEFEDKNCVVWVSIVADMKTMMKDNQTPYLFLCRHAYISDESFVALVDKYSYNTIQKYFWDVCEYKRKETDNGN